MSGNSNAVHIRQSSYIVINLLCVFYFIQNGHLSKVALALTMSIKIKSDRCYAMFLQRVCNKFVKLSALVTHESMKNHYHWATLTSSKYWLLNNCSKLTHRTIYS